MSIATSRQPNTYSIKDEGNIAECLVQLIRFLVVKLTHPGLNPKFNMSVAFTANYSFSGRRRPR
jgi:hypothetical protein